MTYTVRYRMGEEWHTKSFTRRTQASKFLLTVFRRKDFQEGKIDKE